MKPSNYLHELIKSLTKSEKKYFKINTSGKDKGYVKLFNAIDRQKTYNEAKLLAQFSNEPFIKQFSVVKNYLASVILKNLKSHTAHHDAATQVNDDLISVKVLFHKGFYSKALKLLLAIKKKAQKHDLNEELLVILKWQSQVMTKVYSGEAFHAELLACRKLFSETLKILNYKNDLLELTNNAYLSYQKCFVARSDKHLAAFEEILRSPLLSDASLSSWRGSYRYYFEIMSWLHVLKNDFKKVTEIEKQVLHKFEENPDLIKEKIEYYIEYIARHISANIQKEDYEYASQLLDRFKALKTEQKQCMTNHIASKLSSCLIRLQLSMYLNKGDYDEGLHMTSEIEDSLEIYKNTFSVGAKVEIIYSMFLICFYTANHEEALEWHEQLILLQSHVPADDIFCYARLLVLLIHYDLGNDQLLQSELISTRKYLKRKDRLFKLESVTLKYLNKLAKAPDKYIKDSIFKQLSAELQLLLNQEYEKAGSRFIDVTSWVDAKIMDKPLIQVMRKVG